jgi:hypothetical protein
VAAYKRRGKKVKNKVDYLYLYTVRRKSLSIWRELMRQSFHTRESYPHVDSSRHSAQAFVHGLTSSHDAIKDGISLSPAERSRLIHFYISSSRKDGGLGITPGAPEWSRVESLIVMHDQHWNDKWILKWSTSLDINASLDELRAQVCARCHVKIYIYSFQPSLCFPNRYDSSLLNHTILC